MKKLTKMKKLTCFILAFVLICAAGLPAGAVGFTDTTGTKYETAANVLNALGFVSGQGDGSFDVNGTMTRAEYATILMRMGRTWGNTISSDQVYFYDVRMGHWAKDAIDSVAGWGLMVGDNGYFRPDDALTTEEAARGIVILLGYEYLAQTQSYSIAASRLKLLSNFSPSANITRGEVLLMLYSALDVDLLSQDTVEYNEDGTVSMGGSVTRDKTLLTEYFDIYKSRGQVTAVGNLDMVTYINDETNLVRIDNVEYELSNGVSADTGALGCIVDFYYRDAASDEVPVLLYYSIRPNNEIIEATADNVAAGSTLTKLTYYDEDGHKMTQTISAGARFIVNGYFIPDSAKKDSLFDIASGSVRVVIPEDDSSELVWINSYEYYLVQSPGTDCLYLTDGTILDLDDMTDNLEVSIYSANGTATTIDKIISNSAIALAEVDSADGKTYRSVYILKSITGTLQEINGDSDGYSLVLDGANYDAIEGADSWGLRIGFTYQFFIGMDGKICLYSSSTSNGLMFGYLIDAGTSGGISTSLQMKIMNEAGGISIMEVASTFYINDVAVKEGGASGSSAYNTYLYDPAEGAAIQQVVAYTKNEAGEVNRIYTALEDEDAVLSLDAPLKSRRCKSSSIFNFYGEFTISGTGVIFAVPATASDNDDDYAVWPYTKFTNDTSYNIMAYNINELLEADVIVVKSSDVGSATYDEGNTYTCVFDKKSRVLLDDGTESWSITYIQQGTKYTKTIAARSGSSYDSTMAAAEQIQRGDCFMIELTVDGSQIKNMAIEFENAARSTMTSNYNHSRLMFYGQVQAIGPNSIVITSYDDANSNYLGNTTWLFKNAGRVSTVLYTGDDEELQLVPNALADARVGDWVVYQARNGNARSMVIYRDDDRLPSGALK